ncbi:MAG: hypothetical protein A2383_04055 [Candidatus Pacebacteria bacterium RIFOXYB1_FULL_39_46]|nr:MAG: hypothetical protein A2383_04055 [Candidatus Pacebacteria bacterium RIFOXYB1_FULL_39_46]OGJ39131.1 MAG: hypothetical protein A2182_02300 [Candidatus Pacebacteria bacterium RIFOXYA1_FULL_38_18]OGJ40169.1 MAG: hypothetical protein A2582_03710 [Candidatus Pacebacteria bacterium RIFOXYD1_FULL_39_27]OGJ41053.1 MAG: hypothetical protein A2411_01055 [Candidatus Pacebacteria bacterium RIFOXYC1_FULL_39_21]
MPNSKSLILFDIDRTLFNTPLFVDKQLQKLTQTLDTDSQKLQKNFQSYLASLTDTTHFSPDNFTTYLAKYYQHDVKKVREAFYHSSNFDSTLYPEVKEVLQKLQQDGYTLGIFSQGFIDFQLKKLTENNLLDFFDPQHRYILREKADPKLIENLPENTVIIDDKITIITFLERFPHIIPLHIVREPEKPIGEYTLLNLQSLFPILAQLRHS